MKSIISSLLDGPLRSIFATKLWNRLGKNRFELDYWRTNIAAMTKWYRGEEKFREFPYPTEAEKETRYDERTNAAITYIEAENRLATYLSDLHLDAKVFSGKRVADIGSGPMPTLMVFEDCERWCIDHLMGQYEGLGYPNEHYSKDVTYLEAQSESLPVEDGFFDAVISRNALDHVDDFDKTAKEISRSLKLGGWIHILLNYHEPTRTETQVLTDERVKHAFAGHNLRIITEEEGAWGFEGGKTVLWSNLPDDMITTGAAMELQQAS